MPSARARPTGANGTATRLAKVSAARASASWSRFAGSLPAARTVGARRLRAARNRVAKVNTRASPIGPPSSAPRDGGVTSRINSRIAIEAPTPERPAASNSPSPALPPRINRSSRAAMAGSAKHARAAPAAPSAPPPRVSAIARTPSATTRPVARPECGRAPVTHAAANRRSPIRRSAPLRRPPAGERSATRRRGTRRDPR